MKRMPILPIEAYTSQEWFDREQREIFSKTWAFAGFIEDLSEPGEYITVRAGLNNIFVVMGHDHRLRAFHNMCRHRGTQLLQTQGKSQKAITCPYHDWTYDLNGGLISIPEQSKQFPQVDKSCLSLLPASVDTWRGMIWVHPDKDPGPITNWFGAVEAYLGPHRPEVLVEYKPGRQVERIRANWKIVVENYIDAYHLSHLHSGTLNMYDHAKAEKGFVGPHFAFWEPLSEDYAADIEKNSPLPLIEEVPKDALGAWVPMLFPGIGLGESESAWSTFIIRPIGPAETEVEIRTKLANASSIKFAIQSYRSYSFWAQKIRGKYEGDGKEPLTSGDFMAEDIYVCEKQQESLESPFFEHGPSALDGEAPVRQHQQVVLDWLEGNEK